MEKYTGVLPDTRSKKEKKKDYQAIELASSLTTKWKEKKRWKSYSERNQLSTNSCVAQTASKMLEVLNKSETGKTVVFSASPIYAKRANKPFAGMSMHDVFDIVKKQGTTTEKRIQSQMLKSDALMEEKAKSWNEEDTKIAETYGIEAYAYTKLDIESIAEQLEAGRPVMLFIFAETDEYTEYPTIKYPDLDVWKAYIRHAITAVDYGLIKGKKYIKIEDSAHFNKKSVRYLDEDFISKRVYGAGVFFDRDNSVIPKKIKHTFTKPMELGERSEDIKILQDILKKENLFPVATESTGYYGEITRQAVQRFQAIYKVADAWELLIVKGKRVGAKTLKKLNELYS